MTLTLRRCIFGSTLWAAVGALTVQSVTAQAPDSTDLVSLETVWNRAHLNGDADVLDALWAPELVVTVPAMAPMTKAESLSFARSGVMRFQRYETSGVVVRVYGDAAVVTGRLERSRDLRGTVVADDWRFTKVYVRREGAWKVVAFHASPSPPG